MIAEILALWYCILIKVGSYLKAVFSSRNLGLMRISRSRFKQCLLIPGMYVLPSFVNFWVIFGEIWKEIWKEVKLGELRNGKNLMSEKYILTYKFILNIGSTNFAPILGCEQQNNQKTYVQDLTKIPR